MIVAALLLAAFVPGQEAVGPFAIESTVVREEGIPYAIDRRVTTLRWKAQSGLASYLLSDNGGEIILTYQVGNPPRHCLGRTNPLRLSAKAPLRFGRDDFGTCNVLDAAQKRVLDAEVKAALPFFAPAYARFRAATLAQHGPELQRCRETTTGYHGLICAAYWGEGRTTDQQDNKRKR